MKGYNIILLTFIFIALWIYGAILTFKASVLLGIFVFFIIGGYVLEAIVSFFGYDIAQQVVIELTHIFSHLTH
jgi:hypothetical protein